MGAHFHALWNDLWPNTVAPSAWTLLAVVVSHVKQRRRGEEVKRTADAAHRIAADTYMHQTGEAHPDAPAKSERQAG